MFETWTTLHNDMSSADKRSLAAIGEVLNIYVRINIQQVSD